MRRQRPIVYRSYLLRFWEGRGDAGERRFIVELVTGAPRRWAFVTLDELCDFLREELAQQGVPLEQPPVDGAG